MVISAGFVFLFNQSKSNQKLSLVSAIIMVRPMLTLPSAYLSTLFAWAPPLTSDSKVLAMLHGLMDCTNSRKRERERKRERCYSWAWRKERSGNYHQCGTETSRSCTRRRSQRHRPMMPCRFPSHTPPYHRRHLANHQYKQIKNPC